VPVLEGGTADAENCLTGHRVAHVTGTLLIVDGSRYDAVSRGDDKIVRHR
jgi:hypothetical protein